ncbi:MAG: hypothetical protein CMB13_05780 [Euryarchaeota archaeon]|nr:hypothetical protein [Euryarchaeota archaeon]
MVMVNPSQEGRKSDLLLPHESIICGTLHHQQDMDTTEYVLTNDGYIAKYHAHGFEGITNLFRLLHASEIRTVELDHSEHNNLFRIPSLAFLLGLGTLYFYRPFRFGFDVWWNGCNGAFNSPTGYCYSDPLSEAISITIPISLLIAGIMYSQSRKWRLSPGTEVSIGHDSGIIKFADRMNTFRMPGIYFVAGFFFIICFTPSDYGGANWLWNLR